MKDRWRLMREETGDACRFDDTADGLLLHKGQYIPWHLVGIVPGKKGVFSIKAWGTRGLK